MRGEKRFLQMVKPWTLGSSPHARGKAESNADKEKTVGIIPACAGKRHSYIPFFLHPQDHPRMRGEKYDNAVGEGWDVGSSPHARGKE